MPLNVGNAVEVELGQNISDTDTLFDLAAGGKAALPTLNSDGDSALLTFFEDDGAGGETVEIMRVLSVGSGETIQVARGQEGTTAKAWDAGTKIQIRITAELFENAQIGIGALSFTMDNTGGANFTTGGLMAVDNAAWASITQMEFRTSGVNMPTELDPRGMLETIEAGDILILNRSRGGPGGVVAVAGTPTDDGLRITIPVTSILSSREAPLVGSRYALQVFKQSGLGGGGGGGGLNAFPYTVGSTSFATPTTGHMSFEASDPSFGEAIAVHETNGNSQNLGGALARWAPGDHILITNAADPTIYVVYRATGRASLASSVYEVPVVSVNSNGTFSASDEVVLFHFRATGAANVFEYIIRDVSAGTPSSRQITLDAGGAFSVTSIKVSIENYAEQFIEGLLNLVAVSDVIMIQKMDDPSVYGLYTVSAVSSSGGVFTFTVSAYDGGGTFAADDLVEVRPFKA